MYKSTFGIINIGLTCYINSVIQVLIHTSSFLEKFLEKFQTIKKNHNSTSYYFYKMLCEINNNDNLNVIDISNFIIIFKNIHPTFSGINQFDATEFLRVLLEDITILENDNKKNQLLLSKEYKENFYDNESSIISKNFYSQMISIYSFQCSHMHFNSCWIFHCLYQKICLNWN